MNSRKMNIMNAQQDIGWVYPDLKWLTEKEAMLANRKREKLIKSISDRVSHSFMQNKIHIGKLSPGCVICGEGYWSCMFINGLCTAHCFYCPQDKKIKKERPPFEGGGITFDNPQDYVDYLEKFNFKGVGFSGGEPLLNFEKLLTYIKTIREHFGKGFYLWIYTNGDLVDKDKLGTLKEAGLDEIRFNISARDYDLRPVELAVDAIRTVTIEIPSIPEDYERVKRCLTRMQKLGIKHLNIHQLTANGYNYKNYIERHYTFLHYPSIPIFESEIAALKIMRYAIDNRMSLPINYCSSAYKNRFQGKGNRRRKASLVKEGLEELTASGYLRSLSIEDSPTRIKRIIKILQKRGCQSNLWALNNSKTEMFIQGSLLKELISNKYNFIIRYFEPQLKTILRSDETGKEIILNPSKKVFLKRELVAQRKGLSEIAMQGFQKLFIENMTDKDVLEFFYRKYDLKTKEGLTEMKREKELLISLKTWEQLEGGFPELY